MTSSKIIKEARTPANPTPPTHLMAEVRSEVLGDHVFWQGAVEDISQIRNLPARLIAYQVAKDGVARRWGMWRVSAVHPVMVIT